MRTNIHRADRPQPSRWQAAILSAIVLFIVGLAAGPALAADEASPGNAAAGQGRSWGLLIGIEKYHRVPPLRYTINDVHQLAATLRDRGGFDIREMTDDVAQPRYQPLKASIEDELSAWLKQPGPNDTVLVYFSGHGFRDASGKMYLAPIDCNPKDLSKTGLPIEWLRQELAGCKARFKLLILDSCHAGSEKGEGPAERMAVGATDLGEPFKDLEGVVTLASSTAKQQSQIWDDKQQSLFSYWVNQGLLGHADENGDGMVDVDELYKYVHENVKRTAERHMPLRQTPVRIVRSGTQGVPTVVRLAPMTLRQVLADTAEQLADAIADQRLSSVGVLEFTNDTKVGELLGADFGLLGRYCAEEIERRLTSQGSGKFGVVDRRRLQNALKEQGFKLGDLGSSAALKDLAGAVGGMPTVAIGTLRNRLGRLVSIQCKVVSTGNNNVVGSAGGTAVLSEHEWAMLGRSAALGPEDRPMESPQPGGPTKSVAQQTVERLDYRAEGPHPMLDAYFPYPVRIMIGGRERKGAFRGNDYFVPVRKGEVYQVWVENRTSNVVLMRLLVDGLDTQPHRLQTKGVRTIAVAPRVNMDEALAWQLDPNAAGVVRYPDGGQPIWAIRGFFSDTGVRDGDHADEVHQGETHEFLVVDAAQSVAARQQFTDQIGIITAAFYSAAPVAEKRGVGTGFGELRHEEVLQGAKLIPKNLLAVVTIRYVDADALPAGPR